MKLKVLGSSSKGNGYILECNSEILLIECGISPKKMSEAINFNIKKVVGCIVSHSQHGDHGKYILKYAEKSINCYAPNPQEKHHNIHKIPEKKLFKLGNFEIMPLSVEHDVPCFMYLIKHPESGVICFATDAKDIPYTFNDLTNIMVETNYSYELLKENFDSGKIIPLVANRVLKSHISLRKCKAWLKLNDLKKVNNIALLHLSDSNSDAKLFQEEIIKATGKATFVAEPGLEINFNKTGF